MSESSIRPGMFVRRDGLGVGKVIAVDGNPSVLFWANRESGKTEKMPVGLLSPLPGDSPEVLLWERPEELALWATERPLQLVALALYLQGGVGKVSDIRKNLADRVPLNATWANWWKKRTKPLGNLPQHFGKNGSGNEYILLSSVAEVPADWTPPKPATLADWKRWLATYSDEPPPDRYPTKQVCDALAKWPAKDIDTALTCTIRGAAGFLSEKRPPKQAAAAWMEAVSQAAARQRECGHQDYLDSYTGKLLKELALIAGQEKVLRVLADAFVAPEGYADEIGQLRQSLDDANARYARELANLQNAHTTEVEKLSKSHADGLEEQQRSHVAELERERREQERLRERVLALSAQMASGREESRLEVRQGMLLAAGDTLQRAYLQGKSTEDRLKIVITTLPKVLQEGEAETLGTVGATVKYDPKLHHSPEVIPSGVKVRLAAPGVVVGERVILKASVSTESEVC